MWKTIKFVFKTALDVSKQLVLSYISVNIILAFGTLFQIFVFKEIVDVASGTEPILGLSLLALVFLRFGFEIVRLLLETISKGLWARFIIKLTIFKNTKFIDKVSTFDLASFEDASTVGMIDRVFNRCLFRIQFYFESIVATIATIIELLLSVFIFTTSSPLLAILIIVANIIPLITNIKYSEGVFNLHRADDEVKRKFRYTSEIFLSRESLPELKLYQGFNYLKTRLKEIYKDFSANQLKVERKFQIINGMAEFLPILSIFIFTLVIVRDLDQGTISAGHFVFMVTNILVFSGAILRLRLKMSRIISDVPFIQHIIEFYEYEPGIKFPNIKSSEEALLQKKLQKPTISIENVSFSYPGSNSTVLNNINLELEFGKNVALIGPNGAGKSTLVKLLLRIYDPTDGRILINGIDIRKLPEEVLYSLFSTLFQNFAKLHLTIKNNLEIAAGEDINREDAIKFLKFASIWDHIKDLPKDIDQQLGPEYKDGTDFSGGQWQRLAIARAYAKRSPILILDEPTSAVDVKSEMEIFDRLNNQLKDNTLIFISHRFSTIKDAERIIVLKKGKIVEDGNHKELMRANGLYSDLYNLQVQRFLRRETQSKLME